MEAWETDPLDPAYQERQGLVDRYLQVTNKWEEAYGEGDYPGAMACFEECVLLLKPFIDKAKAWSPSHTFEATQIKGIGETAVLYAVTNNKGKLGWLRDTLGRIPDRVKFVPIVEDAMRSRDEQPAHCREIGSCIGAGRGAPVTVYETVKPVGALKNH